MKKYLILSIFVLVLVILGVGIQNSNKNKVCFEKKCFEVEIADDSTERQRGLMFRENLGEKEGMLFIFEEEERHSFWMKNTLIPLDIIWINSEGKIVHLNKNTPPCESDICQSYLPDEPALYVLEVNAGIVEKYGFSEGDIAEIR